MLARLIGGLNRQFPIHSLSTNLNIIREQLKGIVSGIDIPITLARNTFDFIICDSFTNTF